MAQPWPHLRRTALQPLDQITAKNADKLGLAWSLDLDNHRGLEATPLFADGVLYTSLSWSRAMAVDARTGKTLWTFDPQIAREKARDACCDAVNRGVALWNGKVFIGTLDGRLIALDAKTGKEVWSQQTTDNSKPYTITGAPRVVKGKVIIGNGGAEYGVRGYFSAYDAETGKMAWRFYTVPGDPNQPYEHPELAEAAKTWKGDEYWKLGAAARYGTAWPMTLSWTCCTSAPATVRRGTASCAALVAATTSTCPRSSRSTRTPVGWPGTIR